ncbi:MAG: hypothetical protein H7A09_10600 [Oceanospirillaceae bacterium]|nr:hypothetical protein [Oceanospirillaceae bacterium]
MKNLTNFLKMLAGLIVAVTYSIVLAGVLFSGGWTVLAIFMDGTDMERAGILVLAVICAVFTHKMLWR